MTYPISAATAHAYTMTAQDVITAARVILNDTDTDQPRADDAELLRWLNEGLNRMVSLAPGLFAVTDTHACDAGSRQQLKAERAAAFADVLGVPEGDAATLTAFLPAWRTATAGAAVNWLRVPNQQLAFDLYPPAVGGETLVVVYAQAPAKLTAVGDPVPVPENYGPALADYVAGRADTKDDEHAVSGRAKDLIAAFSAAVRG